MGNVVGSNIFNLMFILGISASVHPVEVNLASVCDMGILIAASVLTYIFCLTSKKINRTEGTVLVGIYVADIVFAVFR